jgi:hypothetical protein
MESGKGKEANEMRVTVPLPLVNKANTYVVRFAPFFWDAIKGIVSGCKNYYKKPLYWVAPIKEAVDLERAIGFISHQSLAEDTDGPVQLEIWLSDRLDADAVKAILDGIEMGGRVKNDKMIKRLVVNKLPMKNTEFSFDLTRMDSWGEDK